MKRILTREQFLTDMRKTHFVNEIVENDINWGDSLIGRLVNSLLRKAQIGYNLMRMENLIKLLKNRFDIMHESVQLSEVSQEDILRIQIAYMMQVMYQKIKSGIDSSELENFIDEIKEPVDALDDDQIYKEMQKKLTEFSESIKRIDKVAPAEKKKHLALPPKELPLELPEPISTEQIPSYIKKYEEAIIVVDKNIEKNLQDIKKSNPRKKVVNQKELKKIYYELSKMVHPDVARDIGISEDQANELQQIVNNANELEDIDELRRIGQKISEIKSDFEKRKKYKENIEILNRKKSEKATPKALIGVGENILSNWGFKYFENVDQLGVDTDDEKVDQLLSEFNEIFDKKFMMSILVSKEQAGKLKSIKPSNKLVLRDKDHILEIVRLFKRAWRIHTTENIPSGRTDGKVSNRVFREYEPLGDRGTSDRPGSGPWRNKKLYDKWESAVFDILADNKYKQSIFSENCTFEFQSGGETVAQTNKPLGKILMNFMTRLQSDSKMYQGGAMTQFMKEYFGLDIKIEETSFSSVGGKNDTDVNDKTSKGIVKTQVSFVEQKNALTGSDNIFDYFKNVKHNQKKASQKITFRIAKKQYFTLAYQSKEEFYFYYMNQFSYDKTNIEISENVVRGPIYLAKFDDEFENLKFISISNGADVEDIKIIKNDIEILVDKDGKVFKEIKLFGVDELDFKSMPTSVKNLIGKLA